MRLDVNYIWLQKFPAVCARIPPRSFAAFQRNALLNLEAHFHLWVDDARAVHGYKVPPNAKVHLLDEVDPDLARLWRDQPIFEIKVDLLRLLVLKKILNESPSSVAVYADFDVLDLRLASQEFAERIHDYGMAFAGSYHPIMIRNVKRYLGLFEKRESIEFQKYLGYSNRGYATDLPVTAAVQRSGWLINVSYCELGRVLKSDFENGFIAFNINSIAVLNEMISRANVAFVSSIDAKDPRDTIYYVMAGVLDEWANNQLKCSITRENWRSKVGGLFVQYCSGWKLDDNEALIAETTASLLGIVFSGFQNRLVRWGQRIIGYKVL